MTRNRIKLYFSHSVEHLAEKLGSQLNHHRRTHANILKPIEVIVPNGNMQKYLQLDMAKRDGICANVAFPFLETGLFQALKKIQGQSELRLLNQNELALKIWHLLADLDALDGEVYQPIAHYFSGEDAQALASKKHWQLSQRLALLLLDYELKRPEMVLAWIEGQLVFERSQDPHLRALERMQKDLYLQVMDCQSDVGDAMTLFQLWHRCPWPEVPLASQSSLHLFTPTRLSQFHRQLLCDLAQSQDIHIYQLNVCAEYWQDMQTEGEDIWHQRLKAQKISVTDAEGQSADTQDDNPESFFELEGALTENPLLKTWGKPGREALKLYSQLEEDAIHFDVDFSDEWLDSEQVRNQGVLHLVQDAILFRDQGAAEVTEPKDLMSLQITQAPTIYREVEAVFHNILWNLKQSPDLQPADCAVLVTDMDKYRFVIEQVFGELNRRLGTHVPYALVDASVTVESVYARAVVGLFDLLEHDFLRAELFQWLRNPCVMAALQIDEGDWQSWLEAARDLGIFAGFDQLYAAPDLEDESRESCGTSSEGTEISERFTWRQGLSRLHISLANEAEDHSAMNAESIGQLSYLLDHLNELRLWMQGTHKAQTWEAKLNLELEELLAVPHDLPREHAVASAFNQSLGKLTDQVGDMSLNLHDVRNYLEAELNDLSASKGHYLTGGVVCAALQPMRPIPFKITYVLGMDASSFPGGLRHDTLDLSNRSRRIGDINAIENKQYLFLETLMCSREKLYLSYVGQDITKSETIERSPVLDELAAFAASFMDKDTLGLSAFPETVLALNGEDQALSRIEDKAWGDSQVNFDVSEYLLALIKLYPDEALNQARKLLDSNSKVHQQKAQQFLDVVAPKPDQMIDVIEAEQPTSFDVDIKDLAKFLADAQVEMMERQGMVLKHPEQEALVPHEPFELNGLDRHILYQQAVWEVVESKGEVNLLTALRQAYQDRAERSLMPIELFTNMDQLAKVGDLPAFSMMLDDLNPLQRCDGPIQVGQAVVDQPPIRRLPAVQVKLPNGSWVNLHGVIDGLFEKDGVLQAQLVVSGGKGSGWDKKMLKPFLAWCLLQLSDGVKVAETMDLHLFYSNNCFRKTLRYWATDEVMFSGPGCVRKYLADLLNDYLEGSQSHLSVKDVGTVLLAPDLKGAPQIIKYTGRFYNHHAFSYNINDISQNDRSLIKYNYEQREKYGSFQEIGNLVECDHLPEPLNTMHRRYWPVHAMMLAELPELKAEKEVTK